MAVITSFLSTIAKSVRNLNPDEISSSSEKKINVGLAASSDNGLDRMWYFLAPPETSPAKKNELAALVHPLAPFLSGMPRPPAHLDLEIYEKGLSKPDHAFTFDPRDPQQVVLDILDKREDIHVALARQFLWFRKPVSERVISSVSKENAMFALATSIPNIIPSFLSLPFAVGEFASDTAFITANQLRLAFLLAGAYDRPIGYREQKAQVASVIAGAFGFRAIAREVVGKIPFGAGVIGKASVSYAGTWLVGRGLQKLYSVGGELSRHERQTVYDDGLERGKKVAAALYERFRKSA